MNFGERTSYFIVWIWLWLANNISSSGSAAPCIMCLLHYAHGFPYFYDLQTILSHLVTTIYTLRFSLSVFQQIKKRGDKDSPFFFQPACKHLQGGTGQKLICTVQRQKSDWNDDEMCLFCVVYRERKVLLGSREGWLLNAKTKTNSSRLSHPRFMA